MCLIVVGWRAHADWTCVIAANRDELHARPTAAAHWWDDHPHILAGRDLEAGGTWLGVTRAGRFAAVTNFRDPARRKANVRSRGSLVVDFLTSSVSVSGYLEYLRQAGAAYQGFNLLFSDGESLAVYESTREAGRELEAGVYGLSNHFLDTPWPKVTEAKTRLIELLGASIDEAAALALLRNERRASDAELPDTGVGLEHERQLSSAFIRAAQYGTRSSTLVRTDRRAEVYFDEWSWDAAGREIGRVGERFALASSSP